MKDFSIKTNRDIPSIEIIASDEIIAAKSASFPRPLLIEIIRSAVETVKSRLKSETSGISYSDLQREITGELERTLRKKIARVINGTGILVHTNLGRAPLSEQLFENIKSHLTGYGNLEYDVNSGRRGKRGELAEKYLAFLSESEAGTVVNNNAAALFLILNTLADRKKVVISRGEMVQIGGGFRIPDIIRKSGARLLEIGTTNVTTLEDYHTALQEKPALILKVHRSNFAVSGFTDEVGLKALVELANSSDIPVINDLGSGVFIDTTEFAGQWEPTVQSSVHSGAALTCFSGDKLLGGVQAGLIVGQKDLIDRVKRNPVYRALRVDKTVFSAVEELFGYYLDGTWKESIKLWRLAAVKESELYERGRLILRQVEAGDKIILEGSRGEMGGGALPGIALPSVALVFRSRLSPQKLATLFRATDPPIIGRVSEEHFMIDLKAIDETDSILLVELIKNLLPQI